MFANLADESGNGTATGTGYLLDQIGPGTTLVGNEVPGVAPIAVSVTGNPGLNGMTKVYSNLTLGPGTYFLVIDPTDTSLDWDETSSVALVRDVGIAQGASEVPAPQPHFRPRAPSQQIIISLFIRSPEPPPRRPPPNLPPLRCASAASEHSPASGGGYLALRRFRVFIDIRVYEICRDLTFSVGRRGDILAALWMVVS
jgi:hypothetical protein